MPREFNQSLQVGQHARLSFRGLFKMISSAYWHGHKEDCKCLGISCIPFSSNIQSSLRLR